MRIAYLLLFLLLFSGCSQVGQQWSNFTAYHNTFYNARLSFEEGVKAVEEPEPEMDRAAYLSVFGHVNQVNNAAPFEDAIRRSADILRNHPTSRWVDNAALKIGRSYFYLENYVGAEQKFHEVIALESSLKEEAYFWLGRSLVRAEKYDEAISWMEEALEQESLARGWMGRYYLVMGEAHLHQQAWEEAASELERGARAIPERDLEARAWFLLGQVHETLEQYEQARTAYERASERTFNFDLAYEADLNTVRIIAFHSEAPGEALLMVRRMERQRQYESHRSELRYMAGRVQQAMGRFERAEEEYHQLLSGDEPLLPALQGRIHYALAEIYSDDDDYLAAAEHLESAVAVVPGHDSGDLPRNTFAPGTIADLETKHRAYNQYATAQREVMRLDSLLHLGSLSDEDFEEFVLSLREDKMREHQREQEPADEQRTSWDAYDDQDLVGEAAVQDVSDDEPGSAGFLSYRDPALVQDGRMAFVQRWGDRPLVRNWRRRAVASQLEGEPVAQREHVIPGDEAAEEMPPDVVEAAAEGELPMVDVSAVPRDDQSRAQMNDQRVHAVFDAANALFLALDRPDSAAVVYEQILHDEPGHSVAIRARYALAETYRVRGNTERAHALYRQLVEEHSDSEFAERARELMGEAAPPSGPSEAAAEAELQYREAYERWRNGDIEHAMGAMLILADRYHETSVAPRALFAAGTIFREWADEQGSAQLPPLSRVLSNQVLEAAGFDVETQSFGEADTLFALESGLESGSHSQRPTIIDVYRRLVGRYPDSPQAEKAARVLAVVERDEAGTDVAAGHEASEGRDEHTRPPEDDEDILPGPSDETAQPGIEWEDGMWTVTIVSWPEERHARQSADTFRDRLDGEGHGVDVLEVEGEGGTVRYHVGVGQFSTREEAENVMEALITRLPPHSRVIQVSR